MFLFNNYTSLITLGILLVVIIDTISSILSRKFNFNYAYFSFLSIGAYTFIGYKGSVTKGLACALIITLVMGIFDATIGWEISMKLKANFGKYRDKSLRLTLKQRLLNMLLFSLFCGFIGFLIASM